MKFFSKMRFVIGILTTILIVCLLILYLNNIMSVAKSYRAELAADTITVGADYAGQVVSQAIGEGDTVKKGDPLFTIRSSQFAESYKAKTIDTTGLNFMVNETNGDMILIAGADGVVQEINAQNGSYVSAGSVVASINKANSVYVVGYYRLNPPDYARIKTGNTVEVILPDNTKQEARVFAINLERKGESIDTVLKARLNNSEQTDFRYAVGTPVESLLKINDKPWYQSVVELMKSLIQPVGR